MIAKFKEFLSKTNKQTKTTPYPLYELVGESHLCLVSRQTDKTGRLRLETVDDLFNILQLRKKRRERKAPVRKRQQEAPEIVVVR